MSFINIPANTGGGGSGTVTSVDLTLPATVFDVTGNPVTTSGTIVGSFIDQSANTVFAGPSTGADAAPDFRALVAADIPALPYASSTLTNAHILVGNGSNVATDVAASGDVSLANTGAFTISNGAITNAKVNASAAIAFSKLASLTDGNILVGSALNVPTSVAMSGEASIINSGAVTLANSAVIGKVLTGFTSGAGTISAADSILSAIEKLDGNISAGLTGTANTFAGFDNSGDLNPIPGYTFDPTDFGLTSNLTIVPPVGPSGKSVNRFELEIDASTPAANYGVNAMTFDTHFDRTGSGQDNSNGMNTVVINTSMEGNGTLASQNSLQINQTAGTGTNTGTLTSAGLMPMSLSVGAGFTVGNISGISMNIDASAGTVTNNVNPFILTSTGPYGSNATMISIDHSGNIAGSEAMIRLQHNSGSANDFSRIYGGMSGATTTNYDEINLDSSGTIGGYYRGLTLSRQNNTTGDSALISLSNTGDVGQNENGVFINLTGDVTQSSSLFNAIRSGTISGNGYGIQVNDSAAYAVNSWQGVFLNRSGSSNQDSIGFDLADSSAATQNKIGARLNLTGSAGANAVGLQINTTGATAVSNNGRTVGLDVQAHSNSINTSWSPTNSIFFEAGAQHVNILTVANGSPLSGTAEVGLSAPILLIAHDDIALDPLGLGVAAVGFVGQASVDSGKTVDQFVGGISGFSVPVNGSGGGTVTDYMGFMAGGIFSGGGAPVTDLSVTNAYGVYISPSFNTAGFATNAWGIYSAATDPNFFRGNVGIGSGVTAPTAELDVNGDARIRGLTSAGLVYTDASGNLSVGTGVDGFSYPVATTVYGGNNAAPQPSPGAYSTVVGVGAGASLASGTANTLYGYNAGNLITNGQDNVLVGRLTGDNVSSATRNVFMGDLAGSTVTTGGSNLILGTAADAVDGTDSDQIILGDLAKSNGVGNIAIGNGSYAGQGSANDYDSCISIGKDSRSDNLGSIAIGFQAKAQRIGNTVLGRNMSDAGGTDSCFIVGDGGTGSQYTAVSASGQISFGSSGAVMTDMFLGSGAVDVAYAPFDISIQPTAVAAGTSNTAGADFTIRGGNSTGNANGGSIIFETAASGSSGSTKNTYAAALTLDSDGNAAVLGEVTSNGEVLATGLRHENAQTGTTYTFALSDGSGAGLSPYVTFDNASAITVTVPANGSVAFPIGTQIDCVQEGAGAVTFAPDTGVTINSKSGNLTIAGQYVGVTLIKRATNTWYLIGDLVP